ncbi:MAG: hypothetical protein HY552_06260 [Elusimicrobia bacterium]|nr:hypothetical protein [Elusimicrobiota bacterium]
MAEVLRFPLREVKEKGESPVAATVPPEEFPGVVKYGELVGPLSLTGRLTAQGEEAVFEGEARGRWRIECARCLAPVEDEYAARVEARVSLDGGSLDLSDEVRQAVVLAQPIRTICRTDCRTVKN